MCQMNTKDLPTQAGIKVVDHEADKLDSGGPVPVSKRVSNQPGVGAVEHPSVSRFQLYGELVKKKLVWVIRP